MSESWTALISRPFFTAAELRAAWENLATTQHAHAAQQLWEHLDARTLPLVCPDTSRLTFLWRHDGAGYVHLTLNRITDKQHVQRGLLHHLPDSDIWIQTFDLGSAYVSSYGFQHHDQIPEPRTRPIGHEYYPWLLDPYNPKVLLQADQQHGLSYISNIHSGCNPALAAFEAREDYPSTEFSFQHQFADRTYRISVATANTAPEVLLICPDGEKWQDYFQFAATCAAYRAQSNPEFPTVAVACIHNADGPARMQLLTGASPFVQDFGAFVSTLRSQCQQQLNHTPQRTYFAGQSLGGLTALLLHLHYDPAWQLTGIIAQSPSLWWQPGESRPGMQELASSWIAQQYLHRDCLAPQPRLELQVGLREETLLASTLRLYQLLQNQSTAVQLRTFDGGHDAVWWMAGIIAALEA